MPDPEQLAAAYRAILEHAGEDASREGLLKTPARAAEAWRFLTRGYRQTLEDVINGAVFESDYREVVVVRDLEFYSLCEHHLLPFFGLLRVAYLPAGRLLGLSKIARVAELFARRLQVQERMTGQIAEALMQAVRPLGVAVVCEAQHCCMMMRGVEKQNARVVTHAALGDPAAQEELNALLRTQ